MVRPIFGLPVLQFGSLISRVLGFSNLRTLFVARSYKKCSVQNYETCMTEQNLLYC